MEYSLVIITGLSGAGKSLAVKALEDVGFFCIDNMPPALIVKLLELKDDFLSHNKKIACVVDIRNGENDKQLLELIAKMQKEKIAKIIYLDANEKIILDRYKETRRKHPLMLQKNLSLEDAVKCEKEALNTIYTQADFILDTTLLSTSQLKERVLAYVVADKKETITVEILSFGFKYGLPVDADIVLDVRCLLNPFYVDELKYKTGEEQEIIDFIFDKIEAKELLQKYIDMLDYSMPLYIKEGKSHLTIAFGCTGGKHRSVVFSNEIYKHLKQKGYFAIVHHRDIKRGV